MKRAPDIKIYWENPPGPKAGLLVERITKSGVYEKHVPPSGLLSSTEAAKAIGLTLRHLYNLVNDGKLKPVRKRGRLLFRLSDVKRYLDQKYPPPSKSASWFVG